MGIGKLFGCVGTRRLGWIFFSRKKAQKTQKSEQHEVEVLLFLRVRFLRPFEPFCG